MPVFVTAKRIILFSLVLIVSTASHAENFHVQSAHIKKIGNGYVLNAQINYPLTPRVREAINNGVPITFIQQIQILHAIPLLGKYWQWQETLWLTSLRYQLRYHALSQQFILRALDTGHHRNFLSLEAALTALGQMKAFTLPPEHMLDTDNLIVQVRSGLDLYALPTPMRPGALISNKWQVASPWTSATW